MASHLHETLLEMFRHRPALAAELLGAQCGASVPAYDEVALGATEVSELRPAEHRADAVVVLRDGSVAVFAVIVEVQLRRDDDKPWVWPEYLAGVRRRLRCPAALLVVCTDADTADWAAKVIDPRRRQITDRAAGARPTTGAGAHRSGRSGEDP